MTLTTALKTAAVATVAAAALAGAGTAAAWQSNTFSSPSGNIQCKYDAPNEVVSCRTLNDNWVAAVSLYGSSYKVRGGSYTPGRILGYGSTWTVPGKFRCVSRTDGMTCRSLITGHGFWTSRTAWRFF
jgi:hypothetical protein